MTFRHKWKKARKNGGSQRSRTGDVQVVWYLNVGLGE